MDRIERLKEFLQATPGDSFLKHALALEYVKIGEEDNAKRLFEEILKQEPEYVGSYYHLGKLLERKNEIKLALSVYEKGMKGFGDLWPRPFRITLKRSWEKVDFQAPVLEFAFEPVEVCPLFHRPDWSRIGCYGNIA